MDTCLLKTLTCGVITLKEKSKQLLSYWRNLVEVYTHEFWVSAGSNPGVFLTKDQFIDNMSELSAAENARLEKGEEPLFFKWLDAVFDAVDTNRDGYLQLDEYEKMMKAGNFDTGTAKIVFDMIDTNHDSKLSRQELKDHNIRFWFTPDDPKAAGLYGSNYTSGTSYNLDFM